MKSTRKQNAAIKPSKRRVAGKGASNQPRVCYAGHAVTVLHIKDYYRWIQPDEKWVHADTLGECK